MSQNRTSLEVIAPTVDEAIARGLADLGLPEDAVEIEVLDPGSRGLFGIGSRQVRIRITIKSDEPPLKEVRSSAFPQEPDRPQNERVAERFSPNAARISLGEIAEEEGGSQVEPVQESEAVLEIARDTVKELLDKMKIQAEVAAHLVEPDDEHSRSQVWVDVTGRDLSILIGPHAETLAALQYISALIISKEIGRTVNLVVDVEGYRARRVQQLRRLARRMADQAVKTKRRQILEPMPPDERRIIHMELRNHPLVITESIGEDPRRKVTIIPK